MVTEARQEVGISIVICTFNGVTRLEPTLNAILGQQSTPQLQWELIIVDNASLDRTADWCREYLKQHSNGLIWRVVEELKAGLSYARMRGLHEAAYDWVLFCDDDNHLFPNYLKEATTVLQKNPQVGALGGLGIALFEGQKPSWWDRYSHSYAIGPQAPRDGKMDDYPAGLYGASTFYRKKPLLEFFLQGLTPIMSDRSKEILSSGGDAEFALLIQLKGYSLWYSGTLKFYHQLPEGRLNWSYYLRLKYGIASGTALLFSYLPFFKSKQPNHLTFLRLYLTVWTKSVILYLYFLMKSKLFRNSYSQEEYDLGHSILRSKAISFSKYFMRSFNHFKKVLILRT
jgi:glycosyltransferase involved in cell wall biosynthesis